MKKSAKLSIFAILLIGVFVISGTLAVLAEGVGIRIIKQPTNGYAKIGAVASTQVEAEGQGLTYTWFVKDVNSDTFQQSKLTSNRYTLTMTEEKSGRQLFCVITDINGNSVRTDTVVLSTPPIIKITKQPENVYVPIGAKADVSFEAEGEGLTYQWFIKDVGNETFSKSSITSTRYVYTMTEEKAGRQAYCIVTDKYGNSVTTNTVIFSILNIKITEQPQNVEVPLGAKVVSSFEAVGDGLTYQWFIKDTKDADFYKSAITTNVYSYKMTEEKSGRQAYCVITDRYGNVAVTNTVTFSISNIKITKQPQNIFAGLNKKVSTFVEAEGEGLRYQWYVKDVADAEFKKSSVASNTYTYTMVAEKDKREAYCVITDKYGNSVTTNTVTFVLSELIILEQPKNVGVSVGETATVSVSVKGEDVQYLWFVKNLGEDKFVASENTTNTFTEIMNEEISGRQLYCELTDKVGNVICTETVEMVVCDGVKITKQPVGTHAEIGATIKTFVEAEGVGLTYQWFVKDPSSSTYTVSSIKSNTYTFQMSESKNGRQVYCVITDKYGNTAKTATVTLRKTTLKITKNPYHTSGTIGKTIKTTITAEGEGLTYQWFVKDPGSTTFNKSSLKSNTYSFTLTKEKAGRQVYCIVTDKYGDSLQSAIAVLSTNAGLKIIEQPANSSAPKGLIISTTVVAEGTDLTYQWFVKGATETEFTLSTVESATYKYTMDEQKAGRQVYCVITDSSGNSVTTKTVTLNIAPSLKITSQPTDVGGASGVTVSTSVRAEGVGLQYKWYAKEKGAQKFELLSINSDTYSATVNESSSGREVYCEITDMFGVVAKTETFTVNIYKYYITAKLWGDKTQKIGVTPEGTSENYLLLEIM